MSDITKQKGIPNQTTNVTLFLLQPVWLEENFKYLTIEKFLVHYNYEQMKKLALRFFIFILGTGKIISSRLR